MGFAFEHEAFNVEETVNAANQQNWSEDNVSVSEQLNCHLLYLMVHQECKGQGENEAQSSGVDSITSEDYAHQNLR